MTFLRMLLLAAFSLAAASALAQTAPPPIKDPKTFAGDFFAALQKSGPNAAYDSLKSAGLAAQGVDNLRDTATRLEQTVGPLVSTDFIDEAKLGKNMLRLTYVELHQAGPVLQTLTFYTAPKQTGWRLIGMEMTAEPSRFPFPRAP